MSVQYVQSWGLFKTNQDTVQYNYVKIYLIHTIIELFHSFQISLPAVYVKRKTTSNNPIIFVSLYIARLYDLTRVEGFPVKIMRT